MIYELLSDSDRKILLSLARQSIEIAVARRALPPLQLQDFSQPLREPGASFVTLTIQGDLRGCIGALEAYEPLIEDVRQHAVAAALDDYRFSPVSTREVPLLNIEISRLTPPIPVDYHDPEELMAILRPHIDGVILRDGMRRATFLPQVWEKVPSPSAFLSHLCEKMGAPSNLWRKKGLQVFTYQVEEFKEE